MPICAENGAEPLRRNNVRLALPRRDFVDVHEIDLLQGPIPRLDEEEECRHNHQE